MDNDLLKILESIGLAQKEAGVYLALLELGQGNVNQIAKISGLKRPTIYVILSKLIDEGLVSELPNKKINQYQAQDPSVILAEKRTTLKNFTEMLPLLQTLRNKGTRRPKIQYIESKKGIEKIYENFNFAPEAFFVSSYTRINKHFPGIVSRWINGIKKGTYKVRGKHLIPDKPEEIELGKKTAQASQKVKVFPGTDFNMDFTLCENKLAITSFEDEPFMVLIESEDLVNSMRPIFEIAWKAGKAV